MCFLRNKRNIVIWKWNIHKHWIYYYLYITVYYFLSFREFRAKLKKHCVKLFFLQRKNNISGIPVLLLPTTTRSHDASLLLPGASCVYHLWCWRSVFLPALCCSSSCEQGWNSVNHVLSHNLKSCAKQSLVSCGHEDEHLIFPQQETWSCQVVPIGAVPCQGVQLMFLPWCVFLTFVGLPQ